MIKSVNTIISAGLNSLIPPAVLDTKEVVATDTGTVIAYATALTFLDVKNDDKQENIWIRVGSTVGSIDADIAIRIGPKESLEIERHQLPLDIKNIVVSTSPGKNAMFRVLVGRE